MLLSRRCTYGLRLALYLTRQGGDTRVPIDDIARALGIPAAFLAKTAQDLVHAEILASRRGPGGGVVLARRPETITLGEVVLAIDGPGAFTECVLGLPGCGHLAPCPLHAEWVAVRSRIEEVFARTALDALATDGDPFRLGLPPDPEA